MTWWYRNDIREVDVVTGCFMLVRWDAIKKVGTMDERFFMYGEAAIKKQAYCTGIVNILFDRTDS